MTPKKKTKKKASPAAASPDVAAAEKKFKSDILTRGEAAVADEHGNLPLQATHEIVEENKDDPTKSKMVRRRFKLF